VTVLDDLSAGRARDVPTDDRHVEFVESDVRDRDLVREAVADTDLMFHLAANAHVPTSVERPRYDFEVNASGTQVALEQARDAAVERVVLASSAAVYGPPQYVPIDESHPLSPASPYGASKLASGKLGTAYDASYDIDVTVLRIFNTYGPRQSRYVMYDFLRKLEADPSELEVLGSGEEVRTFAYVSDTVDALVALGVADQSARAGVQPRGADTDPHSRPGRADGRSLLRRPPGGVHDRGLQARGHRTADRGRLPDRVARRGGDCQSD